MNYHFHWHFLVQFQSNSGKKGGLILIDPFETMGHKLQIRVLQSINQSPNHQTTISQLLLPEELPRIVDKNGKNLSIGNILRYFFALNVSMTWTGKKMHSKVTYILGSSKIFFDHSVLNHSTIFGFKLVATGFYW